MRGRAACLRSVANRQAVEGTKIVGHACRLVIQVILRTLQHGSGCSNCLLPLTDVIMLELSVDSGYKSVLVYPVSHCSVVNCISLRVI